MPADSPPVATPVAAPDRVEILDVLRGVALFGVFLVNTLQFANRDVMATEFQLLSLPTAPLDLTLYDVLGWLFFDKANTLFAFLFGLGFYLQMQRLEARGADFERLYRRRLWVLLGLGLINVFFLWRWDILHLYALAGFMLLAMRRLSTRDLLGIGLICALLGRMGLKVADEFTPLTRLASVGDGYNENAVLTRQALSESGDYLGLVQNFANWTVFGYVANGLIFGWLFYALGRFLIGAWVGRHGWITRAREFLPQWRRVMAWSLPLGLVLEGIATLIGESPVLPAVEHRWFASQMVHLLAVPVLATGYVAAVVVGYHSPLGAKLLAPFAWSGRMALTNYLLQGPLIGFVLFGVGPGLALAGKIGASGLLLIVIMAYAGQVLCSRWWLGRFAYGPAEWAWRALTYGKMPSLRLTRTMGAQND